MFTSNLAVRSRVRYSYHKDLTRRTLLVSDLIELGDLIKDKKVLLYQYQKGERGPKRLIREIGSDPQYNYIIHLTADRANEFFRLVSVESFRKFIDVSLRIPLVFTVQTPQFLG